MTSPNTQNELISIIGEAILNGIVKDVKESRKYVIISDETTLNNCQYLTVGVRYVNIKTKSIQEDTLLFCELESATAKSIFFIIVNSLEEAGLSLGNIF